MIKDLSALEKKLGAVFNNKDFLRQSLVHRSYINENPKFSLGHNERLEFLGDAVLELVVTEYLFVKYPNSPEGDMTNFRASLVNANKLSEIAGEIGLEPFLYLSKGESKDKHSKARQYILANALEAVIGAIYLDQGKDAVERFIKERILTKIDYIIQHKLYLDPKSRFQEMAQEKAGVTPNYKVHKEEGPDHAKIFSIGVYLGNELVVEGKGSSKQEAQIEAAEKALKVKRWEE
ncbi:ribonuclease III [Patescibacteria group bacterium]|nr:MAG: ribonuclease III [Patescibacteria group bacterium]